MVLRVERSTEVARELARRFGLKQLPALVVMDETTSVVLIQQGQIDAAAVRSAVLDVDR